jgi:hypothetical protein
MPPGEPAKLGQVGAGHGERTHRARRKKAAGRRPVRLLYMASAAWYGIVCGRAGGQSMTDSIEEAKAPRDERFAPHILPFAIKTCIVAVVISACTIFVADWIIDDFKDAIGTTIANTTGAPFWGKIERELDRAADPASDLPPEKKQKLLNDVRVIVVRWRPFLDTVQSELQKAPSANEH